MIIQGTKGSLTLFYKDELISSYPLSVKKTYEIYKCQGEYIILKSMKAGLKIKEQIYTYLYFCNQMIRLKNEGKSIRRTDSELFLSCIFALIKFNILDEDDCVFIADRKR
mgnify:FL=1